MPPVRQRHVLRERGAAFAPIDVPERLEEFAGTRMALRRIGGQRPIDHVNERHRQVGAALAQRQAPALHVSGAQFLDRAAFNRIPDVTR